MATGEIYANKKPEAESFSYAYVEDADGKMVRVAKDNMKKALGIVEAPVKSVNGKTGAVSLSASDIGARAENWMPSASEVGAEASGTAYQVMNAHNTGGTSHNDIRLLIQNLQKTLGAFLDIDDESMNQATEFVAYMKDNRELIEQVTTNKVSVSDIVDNYVTNVSNKPVSAAVAVKLKALIDAITVPTKLSQLAGDATHRTVTDEEKTAWNKAKEDVGKLSDAIGDKLDSSELTNAVNNALTQAKESGEFNGSDGQDGVDGTDGIDGFSPIADVTQTASGATISIQDKNGTTTATITNGKDGKDGKDGEDGYTPQKGVDYFDGEKGDKGDKGDDGSDYILSDVDKEEIAGMVTVTEQNISDELRKREAIPMVTFVDDDGHKDVLTKLKPLSQTYGIPFVCAVPSNNVAESATAFMNLADLKTLEKIGWEISSHTMSHCKLGELTDLEQEEEIGGSKEAFDSMGLNVQTICYPYSSVSANTYKIARKYFKCGRQTNYKEFMNTTPLETWDLRVTPLGSYFETNTSSGLDTSTLAYYKHMVDRAVVEKSWLIFMTHCNEHDSTQQGYLEQVIQYVQSLNIPVVTLSEGLKKRGNIVDSGRYNRQTLYSSEYFVVGCDSTVRQSDNDKYVFKLDDDSVVNATPITAFPPYAISYCRITGKEHGFPKANSWSGGTLITNTMGFNPDYYPEYRAWQDFVLPNGNGTYRRYVESATTWGEWIDTTPKEYTGITDAEKQEIIAEVVAILEAGGTTPELVNLVPTSIDTDGSIFNGTGYQDGKRFSSGGSLKDQTGSTATGFMPCTSSEKLKLTGVNFGGTWNGANGNTPDVIDGAGGYCYIVLYDSNKTLLTAISYDNYYSGTNYGINITHGADMSETTFDISGYTGEVAKITYVRINAMGSGANMVVNKI